VKDLQGTYRNGQVFLTWNETEVPAGTTFNVYLANHQFARATVRPEYRIAHRIEPHSARDWWRDPHSFISKNADNFKQFMGEYSDNPPAPVGFVIENGGSPLNPAGGLFVHTVTPESSGKCYFAVTYTTDQENTTIIPGLNATETPLLTEVAPAQPIYIGNRTPLTRTEVAGKSIEFILKGRGSGYTVAGDHPQEVNYLFFGNKKQGWREGLPFKFEAVLEDEILKIVPCDRQWTGGRPVLESADQRDHCPAINTWYYGYNQNIAVSNVNDPKIIPNYTEEQILGILDWAQNSLGANPHRTYLTGTSMGGSGCISLALHYPERFAFVYARVPAVAYLPQMNLNRLECFCGPLDNSATTHLGIPFIEHMNAIVQAEKTTANLPYIVMLSGRQDQSIAWGNNPPFFQTMNHTRQGITAFWSEGGHSDYDENFIEKDFAPPRERFSLDRSYLVFTNCPANQNPGRGDPSDGDLSGWINRGFDWNLTLDTPEEYAATIWVDYEGIKYPISFDLTPRRVQNFKIEKGKAVAVFIDRIQISTVIPDNNGLVTVHNVQIGNPAGIQFQLKHNVD